MSMCMNGSIERSRMKTGYRNKQAKKMVITSPSKHSSLSINPDNFLPIANDEDEEDATVCPLLEPRSFDPKSPIVSSNAAFLRRNAVSSNTGIFPNNSLRNPSHCAVLNKAVYSALRCCNSNDIEA